MTDTSPPINTTITTEDQRDFLLHSSYSNVHAGPGSPMYRMDFKVGGKYRSCTYASKLDCVNYAIIALREAKRDAEVEAAEYRRTHYTSNLTDTEMLEFLQRNKLDLVWNSTKPEVRCLSNHPSPRGTQRALLQANTGARHRTTRDAISAVMFAQEYPEG